MTKNIDLYTKSILTVIAACLVYMVAMAQDKSMTDVNIVAIRGRRLSVTQSEYQKRSRTGNMEDPALPVKIVE